MLIRQVTSADAEPAQAFWKSVGYRREDVVSFGEVG